MKNFANLAKLNAEQHTNFYMRVFRNAEVEKNVLILQTVKVYHNCRQGEKKLLREENRGIETLLYRKQGHVMCLLPLYFFFMHCVKNQMIDNCQRAYRRKKLNLLV